MRESLLLSSLNKGLIFSSVKYVNPFGGPLAHSAHKTPTASLSFPKRKKRDLESLQLRLGPGLHPLVDYVWCREEGEGELHVIIPLTIPVPYGPRNGFSSGRQQSGKHDSLHQSGCVLTGGHLTVQIISPSGRLTVLVQFFKTHILMVKY